jgi:hypothetical protein
MRHDPHRRLRTPPEATAAEAEAVGTLARSKGSGRHEGVAGLKRLRMERAMQPSGEPSPEVDAFRPQRAPRRTIAATAQALKT